ncbi:MAG: hypothetical protein IPH32_17390 [Bacteroidetes bacterium]|nr:hypothetical protein [Bacteroidota bacterium]
MISIKDSDFANPKQLITQTVPGIFAMIPFTYILIIFIPSLKVLSENNFELIISAYLFFSILLGALINEIGSWIEGSYDTKISTKTEWDKYLLQPKNDLIIHSVISSVVLRLKFNINMLVSIVLFEIGLISIAIIKKENLFFTIFTIFLSSLLIIFLYKTGKDMAEGLHDYRTILNEKNKTPSLPLVFQRRCCCNRQR